PIRLKPFGLHPRLADCRAWPSKHIAASVLTASMACGLALSGEGAREPAPLVARLRRPRLCSYFLRGQCKYGRECDFAHAESELVPAPDFTNMHMCKAFQLGRCKRKRCRFAHGVQELRPGSVSPPSTPPSRTRLSASSAPFTPACLHPIKVDLPMPPAEPDILGFGAADPLASPLGALEKSQARLAHLGPARPIGGVRLWGPPGLCHDDDGSGEEGETPTASPRTSVASAGTADDDGGLLQSLRDAMLLGVPVHL
ncbi:unnamed protein product, partial [Prorocentrum cordatum]